MSDLKKILASAFIAMVNASRKAKSLTTGEIIINMYEQHYNLAVQQYKAINLPQNYQGTCFPFQFNQN